VNTLFSHSPVFIVIGVLLLGLSGCGARATEVSTTAPVKDAAHIVRQPNLPAEAAPASLETFAALLDRA